jgi:hypothetical protein
MSFRCEFCSEAQLPGTIPQVVVTKTRSREYNASVGISLGTEIVQEKRACPSCYGQAKALATKPALDRTVDSRFDKSTDN